MKQYFKLCFVTFVVAVTVYVFLISETTFEFCIFYNLYMTCCTGAVVSVSQPASQPASQSENRTTRISLVVSNSIEYINVTGFVTCLSNLSRY